MRLNYFKDMGFHSRAIPDTIYTQLVRQESKKDLELLIWGTNTVYLPAYDENE